MRAIKAARRSIKDFLGNPAPSRSGQPRPRMENVIAAHAHRPCRCRHRSGCKAFRRPYTNRSIANNTARSQQRRNCNRAKQTSPKMKCVGGGSRRDIYRALFLSRLPVRDDVRKSLARRRSMCGLFVDFCVRFSSSPVSFR